MLNLSLPSDAEAMEMILGKRVTYCACVKCIIADTFADEREFRFVFDTGTTGTDAIKLNIGDIRDIARPIDPEDPTRVLFRLGQA